MMNDWIDSFSLWFESVWPQFQVWFLSLPLITQICLIIGTIAILILTVILVYYILKGVAYLIYYLLKGIYLLLKAILKGIYRLFKELYYAISGKPKPVKQEEILENVPIEIHEKTPATINQPKQNEISQPKSYQDVDVNVAFCSECGNKFTDRMTEQIQKEGLTYCVYCGKGFRVNKVDIERLSLKI
ncbi:MAG: hypothetical protein P8Y70_06625 [Candidatus Lokiarchaeota archaeon]